MTKFILPKRKFSQKFILYHSKSVFHSCLETIGQFDHKVIVFWQNATQNPMTQWPFIVIWIVNNSSRWVARKPLPDAASRKPLPPTLETPARRAYLQRFFYWSSLLYGSLRERTIPELHLSSFPLSSLIPLLCYIFIFLKMYK